ncbi:MAG: hypothetical protein CR979_01605, partial [Propionibacterium sp.]
MKIVRAVGSLLALLAIVVGVPIVLLLVGQLSYLTDFGLVALAQPINSRFVIGFLTLIAWLSWAVVLLIIIFELVAIFTDGRWQIVLPGTDWLRPAIAGLILSVGTLVSLTPAIEADLASENSQNMPTPVAVEPMIGPAELPRTTPSKEPLRNYTIVAGDDLWTLAREYLGDGSKWRSIAELNSWLDPAEPLPVGKVLKIPVAEPKISAEDSSLVPPPNIDP